MKKQVLLGLLLSSVFLLCAFSLKAQYVQSQKIAPTSSKASFFGGVLAAKENLLVIADDNESIGQNYNPRGVVYIYEKSGTSWGQTARLVGNLGGTFENFGIAGAVSDNTIVISSDVLVSASGPTQTFLYFFEKTSGIWQFKQLLIETGVNNNSSSTSLALSGNTLAMGFIKDTDYKGPVYIYEKNDTGWYRAQTIYNPDSRLAFAAGVGLSNNTLIVSAPALKSVDLDAGGAFIFEKTNSGWIQKQKLSIKNRSAFDGVRTLVKINNTTAMINANGEKSHRGAVYVFEKGPNGWPSTETQKLLPSDGVDEQIFGASIDLSTNMAIIGAGYGNYGAYIFEKKNAGWIETQKIIANDDHTNLFGSTSAFAGETIAVGSYENAYIFDPVHATTGCTITKVRILPRPDCCNDRTLGGKIQISAIGSDGPWKTLQVIDKETPGQWSEFTFGTSTDLYKAVRYLSPDGGYGNIAEIEFYSGDNKISGTAFNDGSGAWNNSGNGASNALDGKPETYYDANARNGAFVGLANLQCAPVPPPAVCALTKVSIFPRPDCCSGRTIGGQIQVSASGQNDWQTVLTIDHETAGQWSDFSITGASGPYKAVRYLSPDGGYGDVGEMIFYNGEQKLAGTTIDDGSGAWSGTSSGSANAFDGKLDTYYDANSRNGAFVGLQLSGCSSSPPPSCAITKVRLYPRPDCCSGRTIGGSIQVKTMQDVWQTVLTINQEVAGQWNEFAISGATGPYKAIRYVSPDGGYGNLAEIEFYNGEQKLPTTSTFNDGSGAWNGTASVADNVFDGKLDTYYDANARNGAFVGINLTACLSNGRLAASESISSEPIWQMQVGPNPSNGRISTSITLPKAAKITLTLTNILGQPINQLEVQGQSGVNKIGIDFSNQPTGLYILRAITEGQKSLMSKLIRQAQ